MLERDSIMGPLQTAVHLRLNDITDMINNAEPKVAAELSRTEIPLLVDALRSVLAEHQPDSKGRCPACRSWLSRVLLRRRSHAPCRAYVAVRLRLDLDEDPASFRRRHVIPTSTKHRRKKEDLRSPTRPVR